VGFYESKKAGVTAGLSRLFGLFRLFGFPDFSGFPGFPGFSAFSGFSGYSSFPGFKILPVRWTREFSTNPHSRHREFEEPLPRTG